MNAPTAAEVAAARYWFSGADPLREPSMGPTTRVHVAVLRAALDAAEARAETAEERALDAFTLQPGCHDDAGKCPTWYDSCHCTSEALREVMTRAETAERELDEARDLARKLAQECIEALRRNCAPSLDLRDTDMISTWREAPRG